MFQILKNNRLFILLSVLFVSVVLEPSLASAGTGGGLPYESWLTNLRQSVSGPVAYAVAIIGMVGAGLTLIFGNADMNGFLRTVVWMVLIMSFIIGANSFLAGFFGTGALI